MPSSRGVIDYLYGLEKHGIKPGLDRVRTLLETLGSPQDSFRSIHVAGTNGKGSVCAMTASVLREAGLKTGLYTSPHLSKFNERISVSGKTITGKELVDAAVEVKAASEKAGLTELTFFEFTTAMAFLYFRRKKVDFAVIETGMGGRLDATNLVLPMVSVITNIDFDHTAWLGSTIKEIASEKAGIIKPGVPVVTGVEQKEALRVIQAKAKEEASPIYLMGKDFHAGADDRGHLAYSGISGPLTGVNISLHGPHQMKNAAISLAAIELLRAREVNIPEKAIRSGLRSASWPGRFEILSKRPLIVLDGAHNPSGALTLKAALGSLKKKRLILVVGIMSDKEIDGILKELVPSSDILIATAPAGERAADPGVIMEAASKYASLTMSAPTVKEACKKALSLAQKSDCVCVAGSLFTVGEARDFLLKSLARSKSSTCK
ncbi:MAG: bifunctional folylpolyglutamate synthase/dihydrofolate synthase [Deltaproteobacteria bacterium]|nr:bifunctional folylpolyglutamate synthase/dihydrofolate synthase [Deltaproteobacteria bacterium]